MDVAEPRPAFAGGALAAGERWELYKLFGEPVRLRIMALLAEEELTVGELAELLGESQSTISRQIKMLRQRSLVQVRKQGVRVFARFAQEMERDPVVADALTAGTHLCRQERVFARAAEVVRRRDAAARAFFSHEPQAAVEAFSVPDEFAVYLTALSALLPRRALAVDIGTGAGPLLELLSPVYLRVLAVDRSEARLALARRRVRERNLENVEFICADIEDDDTIRSIEPIEADSVFASRVLHHAPRPAQAIRSYARLVAAGGSLVVFDYALHEDEAFRDAHADLWMGFAEDELIGFAEQAGLSSPRVYRVPAAFCGQGVDGHLDWQVLVAEKSGDLYK